LLLYKKNKGIINLRKYIKTLFIVIIKKNLNNTNLITS
jgi:hypothetical protein